uniref:G-protein coupled receptors family 1 profile domain-containing protein n=1 Tax=Strigamia maritima TaxID=126957 RepID=T1IX59_STRMM
MEWSKEISPVTESINQTIEPVTFENVSRSVSRSVWSSGRAQIPLYILIFLLAVVGNCLVIVTLVQNKKMRTVTNVFLLNLAVSDLLLGVFCMPFTLVGTLLRQFVFGRIICKAISYIQVTENAFRKT